MLARKPGPLRPIRIGGWQSSAGSRSPPRRFALRNAISPLSGAALVRAGAARVKGTHLYLRACFFVLAIGHGGFHAFVIIVVVGE